MRHQVAGKKLGRKTAHREAMFRNMAISLIQHGRITTTIQKAKELRAFAERLVGLGKSGSLHDRRLAFDRLRSGDAVQKLFQEIAPAFKARHGGYTRILKMATRHGDAAQMAMIEYLNEDLPSKSASTDKSESKKAKKSKSTKSVELKIKKEKAPKDSAGTEKSEGVKKAAKVKTSTAAAKTKKATSSPKRKTQGK